MAVMVPNTRSKDTSLGDIMQEAGIYCPRDEAAMPRHNTAWERTTSTKKKHKISQPRAEAMREKANCLRG